MSAGRTEKYAHRINDQLRCRPVVTLADDVDYDNNGERPSDSFDK